MSEYPYPDEETDEFGQPRSELDRQAALDAARDLREYEQHTEDAGFAQEPAAEDETLRISSGGMVDLSYQPFTSEIEAALQAHANEIVHLSLTNCSLSTPPDVLQRMPNLKRLRLDDNGDMQLADWLWELPLEELGISGLRLAEMPAIPGSNRRLRVLEAARNYLRRLPSGFTTMERLEILNLSDNNFATIPEGVFTLPNLKVLRLDDNRIRSLPPAVGTLVNLQELDLSGNQLTDLPIELGQLPDTILLRVEDNRLDEAAEALDDDIPALLSYIRSLADSREVYEAKLMLVGEGNVGKTTLLAALRNEPFVKDRATTHGIELNRFEVVHPHRPVEIQLNTWDFGGQEVYRITHQFFFTRRALYLLVWKPREGQEENAIDGWCRRLKLRVGDDARIILVATHADERQPEIDYYALIHRYKGLIAANATVDSASGFGLDYLVDEIADTAAELPQMGMRVNNAWLSVKDALMGSGAPHVSRLHLERLAASKGIAENDVETLATLLHDLGYIIYYGADEGLSDIVVLQPEWLTKAIGYVLEDAEPRESNGIITHARLSELWSSRGYPTEYHRYFLRLMEKFDVSYRLPDQNASLIGQLVPYIRPRIPWASTYVGRRRIITVVCRMSDAAPGLIAWLTVRNHRFSTGVHWRRGVFLRHPEYDSEALFEMSESRREVRLTVAAPAPDYFYNILRDSVDHLINIRWPGLRHEFLVPCGKKSCRGYFGTRILRLLRERNEPRILCQTCGEYSDVMELLTGFEAVGLTEPERLIQIVQDMTMETTGRLKRIEAISAHSAQYIRRSLMILSSEVNDCPRLFTISRVERGKIREKLAGHEKLKLTLWCEEPGEEHPVGEPYSFESTKGWLRDIAPYARIISRVIKIAVPVATAAYAAALTEQALDGLHADLTLMDRLAATLPGSSLTMSDSGEVLQQGTRPAAPSAADMRHFRRALFDLDPSQTFAGLARVVAPSGDFLWVCESHKSRYDPGLPELPPPPRIPIGGDAASPDVE